jgi:Fe-S-cluster containining protein
MPNNLNQHLNKQAKQTLIKENEGFKFTCAKECWGTCCIKENVVLLQLSVYDTYKLLSKRTDLNIVNLIDIKIDEETNLPRAFIKWKENGTCPNLSDDGSCKVYMDRPFSCRIFPLSSDFMINDSTGNVSINYKLRENLCYGFHKEANPQEQTLKTFLFTDDFQNHENFEKLEVGKRQEWIKKYDLKKLSNQQLLNLAQAMYCLKETIAGKKDNFFDFYSELLKIPKRSKRLEIFPPEELTKYALEEFAPRMLEKFRT